MTNPEAHTVYHHPFHQENYDTEIVRDREGELAMVVEALDEVLYPEGSALIRATSGRYGDNVAVSHFRHEYLLIDTLAVGWPFENVQVNVDHTRMLGRSAVKEMYKVQTISQIKPFVFDQDLGMYKTLDSKITSSYYIEQLVDSDRPYLGCILRPNIIGDQANTDEPMTAYDCDQLLNTLEEIRSVAWIDAYESRLSAVED